MTKKDLRGGETVEATRRHGGALGRSVRVGDRGTVEGVRTSDDRPVVQWHRDDKTRRSNADALRIVE